MGALDLTPAFLVSKKGKMLGRVVVNYKRVNSATRKDVWKGRLNNFSHLMTDARKVFLFVFDAELRFLRVPRSNWASRLLAFSFGEKRFLMSRLIRFQKLTKRHCVRGGGGQYHFP